MDLQDGCTPLAGYAVNLWQCDRCGIYSLCSQAVVNETGAPETVYGQRGYEPSVANLARISLASDNVFSDGATQQLATMSGDASGYVAELTVSINA